jgi:hypothetical protein
MAYKLMLECDDILLKRVRFSLRKNRPCNCITTRVVYAPNEQRAGELAIEDAHDELVKLLDKNSQKPVFKIVETTIIDDADAAHVPKRGFLFY